MHVLYIEKQFTDDPAPMPYRFVFEYEPGFPGNASWPEQDEEFFLRQVCVRIDGIGIPVDRDTFLDAFDWFHTPEGMRAAINAMEPDAALAAAIEQKHAREMAHERRAA